MGEGSKNFLRNFLPGWSFRPFFHRNQAAFYPAGSICFNTWVCRGFAFHEAKWELKTLAAFVLVYISGFVIESVGVNTGLIFGEYIYGKTLGYQIFETPLIIGMNWLFLVYVSSSLTERLNSGRFISFLLPPVLMVIYDLVLEQVAPDLGMWNWKNEVIPLQNYIAWFVVAFIFVLVFGLFNIKTSNKIAPLIFILQFLFFLLLMIFKL
jgi:bisanhydrobacterioruberin hydratase